MEKFQRDHIRENLSDLVTLTDCNVSLLSILRGGGVISDEDVEYLQIPTTTGFERAAKFYDIIVTRVRSYDIVRDALRETCQTGALYILDQIESSPATASSSTSSLDFLSRRKTDGPLYVQSKIKTLQLGQDETETTNIRSDSVKPRPKPLPELPSYYIKRRLRSRYNLKENVFRSSTDDIFVVEGIEKHYLTKLASGSRTDTSGRQIDGLTVRHIKLEGADDDDYYRICKLTSQPVHLIKHNTENNSFMLRKSSRAVCIPQKYVHDNQDYLTEEEIASKTEKAIIISGSPGAGKTMLLQSIAHHKIQQDPESLVIFLVTRELVQLILKRDASAGYDSIFGVIAKLYYDDADSQTQENYLRRKIESEKCTILLDGFDEVLKPHVWVATRVLGILQKHICISLFVTTRSHLLEDLENNLLTMGFTIELFSETDQRDFFLRFWESEGVAIDQSVNNLATACLTTLTFKMENIERDIAGLPLQSRILAEVYMDRAIRCSKVKFEDEAAPAPFSSIFKMYKRNIELRINEKDKRYKSIIQTHMFYALEYLFPDETHIFKELCPTSPPILESQILRLGLLEKGASGLMQFVHPTFAEFFVAWFAFEKDQPYYKNFILSYLISANKTCMSINTPVGELRYVNLFSFNYPTICYFINGFTKENFRTVDQNDLREMFGREYDGVSQALIASAFHNFLYFPYAVARFLRDGAVNLEENIGTMSLEVGTTDFTDLLIASAMHADVEMMELFCSVVNVKEITVKTDVNSFSVTPLHIAVRRGDYRLVEYLVGKFEPELINLRFLLHFCVFESSCDDRSTVDDKKQIIILLSSKCSHSLVERLDDNTVPLSQKNVHAELLECLHQEIEKIKD